MTAKQTIKPESLKIILTTYKPIKFCKNFHVIIEETPKEAVRSKNSIPFNGIFCFNFGLMKSARNLSKIMAMSKKYCALSWNSLNANQQCQKSEIPNEAPCSNRKCKKQSGGRNWGCQGCTPIFWGQKSKFHLEFCFFSWLISILPPLISALCTSPEQIR